MDPDQLASEKTAELEPARIQKVLSEGSNFDNVFFCSFFFS